MINTKENLSNSYKENKTGVVRVIEKLKRRAHKQKSFVSPIKTDDIIDYKNTELLKKFLTSYGKIRSRRSTNLSRKQQTRLTKAVKRARMMKLLPYVVINEN